MGVRQGFIKILLLMFIGSIRCSNPPVPDFWRGCPNNLTTLCQCGKVELTVVEVPVKSCEVNLGADMGVRCIPCPLDQQKVCIPFQKCDSCTRLKNGSVSCTALIPDLPNAKMVEVKRTTDGLKKTTKKGFAKKVDGIKKSFLKSGKKIGDFLKKKIGKPSGEAAEIQTSSKERMKRYLPQGALPCVPFEAYETANMTCHIWPEFTKCHLVCMEGYEIHGKIEITSKCYLKNPDEWKPYPLGECSLPQDPKNSRMLQLKLVDDAVKNALDPIFDAVITDLSDSLFFQIQSLTQTGKSFRNVAKDVVEIHIAAGERVNPRHTRQEAPRSCVPASGYDTAEIHCWIWPDHTKCRLTCIHGYQIDGKSEVISKCFDKNPDVWKPHALGECTPHLNCQAELISPGNLTCYALTMEPPMCYISCKPYDDNHELPKRKYTCYEEFDPPLPFCAQLKKEPEEKPPSSEEVNEIEGEAPPAPEAAAAAE